MYIDDKEDGILYQGEQKQDFGEVTHTEVWHSLTKIWVKQK